jgi:hypothetical protein
MSPVERSQSTRVYQSVTATFPKLDKSLAPADKIIHSLVTVEYHTPFLIDGLHDGESKGFGLVLEHRQDTKTGLILCDRTAVPTSIGDVYIHFASSILVPGLVVFVHPTQNFSVISYDPTLLGKTPIRPPEFDTRPVTQGDDVVMVVLSSGDMHEPLVKKTRVTNVSELYARQCPTPRFRSINAERIEVDEPIMGLGGWNRAPLELLIEQQQR